MELRKYFKKSLIFAILLSNVSFLSTEAKNPPVKTTKNTKQVKVSNEDSYNDAINYFNKGKDYEAKKSIAKAIENYKIAIKKNPDLDAAYSRLGLIYAEKGDYKNSIEMFKKYLTFSNDPEERALVTQFINKMSTMVKK